jgi:septal ring factor EnvC (AmiA/AmiB activator)
LTHPLDLLFFFLQSEVRKHKQMQRALEASEHACSTHAASAAKLQQHICKLEAQLLHLQDRLTTHVQQQAQLQQQLGASQSQLGSTELQIAQLKNSVETLQAQVGHQCSDRLRTETGQGCSVRGSMSHFLGIECLMMTLPSALHAPYALRCTEQPQTHSLAQTVSDRH